MVEAFEIFERLMICLSPFFIAWMSYRSSQNEKQMKKYMESHEELKRISAELKEKEQKELQEHLSKIDKSIASLTKTVNTLEDKVDKIGAIDKQLERIVDMSNADLEFCQSLSSVISSIGNALDSSEVIPSGALREDLKAHKKREQELLNKVFKIVY